jgi:hypothetical protein
MEGATQAWTSMSYGEGILFTLWLAGIYYLKCRMDNHFASKRKNMWSNGLKATLKEALIEWEKGDI